MFLRLIEYCLTIKNVFLSFIFPNYFLKDLHDDIILITGAGKGVGRLIATQFAKLGPKHVCYCSFYQLI